MSSDEYKKFRDDFDISRAIKERYVEVIEGDFSDIGVEDVKHGEIKIASGPNEVSLVFRVGDNLFKIPVADSIGSNSSISKPGVGYPAGLVSKTNVTLDNEIAATLVENDFIYYDGNRFNKISKSSIIPKGLKKVALFSIDYSASIWYIIPDFSDTNLVLYSIDIVVIQPFSSGSTFSIIVSPSENAILDSSEFDITQYGHFHKDFIYPGGEELVRGIISGTPSEGLLKLYLTYTTETNGGVV